MRFIFVILSYSIYHFAMLFLTIDRLLTATLGERYTLFWSKQKSKWLIFIIWGLLISLSIVFHQFVSAADDPIKIDKTLQMLFYLDFAQTLVNLIAAVSGYGIIFKQLWRYSRGPDNISNLSFLQVFRGSKYYTAVLRIISYLCLMVMFLTFRYS